MIKKSNQSSYSETIIKIKNSEEIFNNWLEIAEKKISELELMR